MGVGGGPASYLSLFHRRQDNVNFYVCLIYPDFVNVFEQWVLWREKVRELLTAVD